MSRSKKKTTRSRQQKQTLNALEPRALTARGAGQVKGGAGPSGKAVARYHLEHAWPSK